MVMVMLFKMLRFQDLLGYTWINGKLIIYSSLSISNNQSTLKATKNSIKVEKFWLLLSVINFHFNVRWKFAIILV